MIISRHAIELGGPIPEPRLPWTYWFEITRSISKSVVDPLPHCLSEARGLVRPPVLVYLFSRNDVANYNCTFPLSYLMGCPV